MKRTECLWLLGCLFVLSLAGGCSSGGGEEIPTPSPTPTEKDVINVTKDAFQTTNEGGEVQVSFTTNQNWTASSNQSWCTLSPTSGAKGSASIKATVTENTTFEKRTATVILRAGTASQNVTITQEAGVRDKLEVPTVKFNVAAEGKEVEIPFDTDVAWEAASNQKWCTLSATSGEAGNQSITVAVDKNTTYEDRTAVITLKAGNNQMTVTITQEKSYVLIITQKEYTVKYAATQVEVKVECNASFEISVQADWLRQVKSRSLKEDTLLFEVDQNDNETGREAEIILFNEEKNLRETFIIKQEGKPEDTSVTPNGNIGDMTWG